MNQEIEAKFLHIDIEKTRQQLKKSGAKLIQPMTDVRRVIMDFPDYKLDKKRAWLRIRENSPGNVTLTYKQKNAKDVLIDGVTEIEVMVAEYDQISQIFKAIGLIEKSTQHTKRETWKIGNCEVVIDVWPWVDPYIEIESETEQVVRDTADRLGFKWSDAKFGDIGVVYFDEYDMSEDELYKDLKYLDADQPIPDWLLAKRKK